MAQETVPAEGQEQKAAAPHLVVAPMVMEKDTGAVWVHKDYALAREAWETEGHVSPPKDVVSMGDVESWVSFVKRFGQPSRTLTMWTNKRLTAILDYHEHERPDIPMPGRCQWIVNHFFLASHEWTDWTALGRNQAVSQKEAVEWLEEHAEDIHEPDAAELMQLLRSLRANVSSTAVTELRADGTTEVSFSQDKRLVGFNKVALPSTFTIMIPILKNHVDDDKRPFAFSLMVRLRATVDDNAHLSLRFSLQFAERVWETVLAERVAHAEALLGDSYHLLRAAD